MCLGSLEFQQALDTPSLRTGMSVDTFARLAKGIALVAPLGGFFAPIGGSGADVFSGTGMMSPDLARSVTVICFWVAAVGQVWALVDWWRLGRPKDGYGIAAAFLAMTAVAGAIWFHSSRADPATLPMLAVPIILTGLLGAVSLVARLIGSQKFTVRQARLTVLGERMRSLPGHEQQALHAERREILDALDKRDLVHAGLAERAAAAPLGDWWLLDAANGKQ
ncbi:hypothetical protein [Mycetocola zhadangensis]|uniref:Uncharacterized protein n=1 Tax=Mycetocola zhadangensis TaxID=1164595 RepID=A0A3L7ISA1_9MICO|nr:hypothetical protein [Mycetocola zhadangensis]RLQ81047.1 hypothetical protein D9V28_14960 [Mycetocola zhadangensis]GGF04314.1 hypothetical protein GCM10011313_29210 [Mycetocola zhadangensis]